MSNLHTNHINNKIKVISKCFVKPKYEVEASKQPYYLGVVDLAFLSFDQIQKGLLFSRKPKNIEYFLEKLKESLAFSLVHYYPLAGRFTTEELPDENSKLIYVDCSKGPGARLIHTSVEYTVSDILSSVDVHPIVRSFFDLGEKARNYDGHTRPLLSIQVTELVDGVFIGFTVNHSMVDGNSQWHYINSLSEIFNQLSQSNDTIKPIISRKPIFEPYFPDGWGPDLKLSNSNPLIDGSFQSNDDNKVVILRERIFHFSSESIRKLKFEANKECNKAHNISSFQALIAFMWRSITRARNLRPEHKTTCALVMDSRSRFSPQLSNDYFGNFIIRHQRICTVGDILSSDFGSVSKLVNEIVASQNDKEVRELYEKIVKFLCCCTDVSDLFYGPNMVVVGGSSRFNTYGPEFGLGKAEAVLAGYSSKEDGKITANPGREGGGSVDLEVCLKPETMNALELDDEFMSFVTLA